MCGRDPSYGERVRSDGNGFIFGRPSVSSPLSVSRLSAAKHKSAARKGYTLLNSATRSCIILFLRPSHGDDDPAAFWTAMEAERMLRFPAPSIAGRLQQLEGFLSPPAFY